MNFPDFDFRPKGPEAIRSRVQELRGRIDSLRHDEFQNQLDQATLKKFSDNGTPASLNGEPIPMTGKIGMGGSGSGDDKLGPLPPASPADFTIENAPTMGKQADRVQIQGLIAQVSREQNVDQQLLKAVVEAESDYNQNEVSKTGALGLMQLMPDTMKSVGVVDPFNPYENLTGGAKYLNQMIKRYNGNVETALAAYNAGPTRVDQAKGIPNIPETQHYVDRIMRQIGRR